MALTSDELRAAERWLAAFTFWLRNGQPHNAEALRERGLAVQAGLPAKTLLMGVEVEGFRAFTCDMLELISKNDIATALELSRLAGALGEAEPTLHEATETFGRALTNHFEGVVQDTFQVSLGYIGTTDDHSVQVTNEDVDVNIVREDGQWWIKVFGASDEFIKPFDFRRALKLIINVKRVRK